MTTKQQTASHEMIVKKNFNQSSMANTQHYGAEHPAMTTIFISRQFFPSAYMQHACFMLMTFTISGVVKHKSQR
jgi:hypothetical protein